MTGRLTRGVMWDVKASRYLKKRPDSPFALFLAGWSALLWGDAARADRHFDGAILADARYAPAYIGKACCEINGGRYYKAALSLYQNYSKINADSYIGRFRAAAMISAFARPAAGVGADGFFARLLYVQRDMRWRGLLKKIAAFPYRDAALPRLIRLIRYIELSRRSNGGAGGGGAPSGERLSLSAELLPMPGLLDEFRLALLNELSAGTPTPEARPDIFTYDNPAIFVKPLLNKLFREQILSGALRGPRVILANLRRDACAMQIDDVNKWLFLQLSGASRRNGKLESDTADELFSGGWWADPVVRYFRGSAAA